MKISLIISFLSHIILLLAFQKFFPLNWNEDLVRTYRVDIIRPPAEDIDFEGFSEADITQIIEAMKAKPIPRDEEATISLDTKDKQYVSYAKKVKQKILRHWRYPPEAREYLLEGSLMVVFSLGRNGNMIQLEIINNSQYEILDREAVRAIRGAAPFPPFPEHIRVKKLNIRANFNYRLTSRR